MRHGGGVGSGLKGGGDRHSPFLSLQKGKTSTASVLYQYNISITVIMYQDNTEDI